MNTDKHLIKRISAIVLIILGIVFGGTWSSTMFCLGDNIFSVFGIPAWSKETSGTHYPAIVGMVIILIGGWCIQKVTLPNLLQQLAQTTGIFKGKERKALEKQIQQTDAELAEKQRLL